MRFRTTFVWESNRPLPEGFLYEPAFWQESGDPVVLGRGWAGSTTNNSMTIGISSFVPGTGRYFWGVRILDATGKPLRFASQIYTLNVQVDSGVGAPTATPVDRED